jgi:2-methylisocitrate lyase-like PEP mutase family enzyme
MATLRQMLNRKETIVAPGVGDAFSALMAEKAGFSCVHLSGYYAAALLGYPDVGLVTMSEMVAVTARICDTVSVPMIADADNGYGNAINVIRTVREFERAGAAALHLEDQVAPKKCGAMQGHVLVSSAEMCGKIEAAVDARKSDDFLIIARSDAIKVNGIADAIRRGNEYRRAGADVFMAMAPSSIDDLKRYRDGVQGPLLVTIGSWDFKVTLEQLKQIGYEIVVFPLTAFRTSIVTMRNTLEELKKNGYVDHSSPAMMSVHDLHNLMGLKKIIAQEDRYLREEQAAE